MGGWRDSPARGPTGKRLTVSEWAGGYTEQLAEKLILGAEVKMASRQRAAENFPVDADHNEPHPEDKPHLEEEQFMDADDAVQDEWSANELPAAAARDDLYQRVPKEIRQAARKAHCSLGHPSRGTFLRMMCLGGAPPAAMDYAKSWICPVCAASAAPGKPFRGFDSDEAFWF